MYAIRSYYAALIDTVNPGFEEELEAKINMVSDLEKLDYLIMNHAEPDHANAIRFILEKAPYALFVTTEKGVKMAKLYHELPEARIKIVAEGDSLDLGGKTLRFIEAVITSYSIHYTKLYDKIVF